MALLWLEEREDKWVWDLLSPRDNKEQVRDKSSTLPERAIPAQLYRRDSFIFRTRATIRRQQSLLGGPSPTMGGQKNRPDFNPRRDFSGKLAPFDY
jgi:hypothetical protein